MEEKFAVKPTRITRARKIQVRQFEPEEIRFEFELLVNDPSAMNEAMDEATRLAKEYLDTEEAKLRNGTNGNGQTNNNKPTQYQLELTSKGKSEGLVVKPSTNPQYKNFIHLWHNNDKKVYLGYLRRDTGQFIFKNKNGNPKETSSIKEGTHFKITAIS